ncbi:conserved hypothetical protein, secreted [Candidatus Magnetomorum sp. HK-1]|nr:conserved hypothetical protein, secreted [Candidatus Magnetomorum sp. HK-1]
MKTNYIAFIIFIIAFLISNNVYAANYEYSFCYGNNASVSTSGGGTWGSILKITVWINSNNTVSAKIEKKDGSAFSSSGYMYLQGYSYGIESKYNLASSRLSSGFRYIRLVGNLNNDWWRNDQLKLYGRLEPYDGGYAWVGPVYICRKNACTKRTYYFDNDRDGYGNPNKTKQECSCPSGYVSNNNDCNDNDRSVHSKNKFYVDSDKDGVGSSRTEYLCASSPPYGYASRSGDCNDNDRSVQTTKKFYVDADRDGAGIVS